MNFLVRLFLHPNDRILPQRRIAPVLPWRARRDSNPQPSDPKLPLHLRTNSEHLLRRYTFDHCYQLRHAIRRHLLHQKMNVILIHSYFQKLHLITSLYLQIYVSNYLVHRSIKHCPSILRRKHHVGTTTPLHYGSYVYTRSPEHFTPRGAGNKSRSDSKLRYCELCFRTTSPLSDNREQVSGFVRVSQGAAFLWPDVHHLAARGESRE